MRVALCYDLLRFSLCSGDLCVCLLQAFTIPPPPIKPNYIHFKPQPSLPTYIDMYLHVKLHVSVFLCMYVCEVPSLLSA